MATVFKRTYRQDLTKPLQIHYDLSVVFSKDNLANEIQIDLYNGNEAASISGTVSGTVIRANGSTVPIETGTISGNAVTVALSEACMEIPGPVQVYVKLTTGDVKTTIFAGVFTAIRTETETIIDPGTIIPSVTDLINQIQTAIDSIPADYSTLLASVAGTYSTSKTYAVGDYAWYDGRLKKCIVPITTAETWTAAHWADAVIADDVAVLKSAIAEQTYNIVTGTIQNASVSSSGEIAYSVDTLLYYAPVESGKSYTVTTNEASLVCGFYNVKPEIGAISYNQQRVIQATKSIESPITGYIVCRAVAPYTTCQIVEGTETKEYLPPLIANDFLAREEAEEAIALGNDNHSDISGLTVKMNSVYPKVISDDLSYEGLDVSDTYNLYFGSNDMYYSVCVVPSGTYLERLELLAGRASSPTLALAYWDDDTYKIEWYKNLGEFDETSFHSFYLNYKTEHECYVMLNYFGYARSATRTEIPKLITIRNYTTPLSWNDGTAALDYTVRLYMERISDIDAIKATIEKIPDVDVMASDIAMFENIGFCGDSYMAGMIVISENPTVTAQNQNLSWGKILERTHGINAFIYAKGGITTNGYRSDADCLPKLLSESAKQLYVISLGHNDAYAQTDVSAYKTSYRNIIDSIIEHAPNAKIILCRQSKGYGNLNNGPELNEAISELGVEYGIPVLNPEDDPYLSSSIYVQTQVHRHPTFAGYAGMAEAFNRLFNKATVDYWDYFKAYTGLSS